MLTIIPTPIGNLGDITSRSLEALRTVEYLLVEDSRITGKLLSHLAITKKMIQFHAHNEHGKLESVIQDLQEGKQIGMVTDAGTPCISDPGFLLVRECVRNNIEVTCLPGPTAFVPALAVSGLPSDTFYFAGFLPRKKGRKTMLEQLTTLDCTILIYESPYRVVKTLQDIQSYLGNRTISVSRELSKKFEETKRGTCQELITYFDNQTCKGEFVVCIAKEGYVYGE